MVGLDPRSRPIAPSAIFSGSAVGYGGVARHGNPARQGVWPQTALRLSRSAGEMV
jgi:hypothetical protein